MGSQRLTWAGGLRFEGEDSRGFRFPVSGEEGPAGAKPSDLLPISLAACTAYDVVNVLRKQRQELGGLEVRIDARQEERPPWRFLKISMRFVVTGAVDPRKAERALALGLKDCSVHASIERCVPIEATIEVEAG